VPEAGLTRSVPGSDPALHRGRPTVITWSDTPFAWCNCSYWASLTGKPQEASNRGAAISTFGGSSSAWPCGSSSPPPSAW
jgi:hypothetical protein